MAGTLADKWPVLGRHERAAEGLGIRVDLGRAPRRPRHPGSGGGRAVTVLSPAGATQASAAPAWPWPLNVARYDRRPELTGRELEALRRLGMNVRRGRCYDGGAPERQVIDRLLQPLDDAGEALWCPAPLHRRAVTDAIGLVLLRCAQGGTTYWAWSDEEWARLIEGTTQSWASWVERWYATSALTSRTRGMVRGAMAKAGRWLAAEYPEITEPGQWTRQTCAAWVAAIDRMNVGQYIQRTSVVSKRDGRPISPQMKAGFLTSSRAFFRDCQEWEWIPRRFDPARTLATPATIRALIGPNPPGTTP
jgi:hypothetical protein